MTSVATPGPHAPQGRGANRLILMSSRGPVEHQLSEDGTVQRRDSDGGVATVLSAVAKTAETTWPAGARSEADRLVAERSDGVPYGPSRVRFISAPQRTENIHNDFCNTVLWFLQHSMLEHLELDDLAGYAIDALADGYLPMNLAYAQALAREAGSRLGSVMIDDYHLYEAPRFIRARYPEAYLQHFVHIPWPEPEQWAKLPEAIPTSLVRSLVANDSLVFQTRANVANFLDTLAAYLPSAEIDHAAGAVMHDGRLTRVWANPVSVEPQALLAQLDTPEAAVALQRLTPSLGQKTIVRVDRMDPSKNIKAGFEAYERLLETQPEWRGRVRFLAFLVPTRGGIGAYQRYAREVMRQAQAINQRFGDAAWQPIQLFYQQDRLQAVVALSLYDVLLVNSLADGLNLVSKEGAVLNRRDGVMVLSRSVGSYQELAEDAISVQPLDTEATADALHQALSMPQAERHSRALGLRDAVQRHQFGDWLSQILLDMPPAAGVRAGLELAAP